MHRAVHQPKERQKMLDAHRGRTIATLFYEPSTRTRLSFETAAQRLGVSIISTEHAGVSSSAKKGESLEDTIRVVSSYCDAIVLRHPELEAAHRAAKVSSVPIINAGDGGGEHPTQALLDIYTAQKEKKKLDGLAIGLAGDLKHSRVIHSFLDIMSLYNVDFYLIAPKLMQLPKSYRDFLRERGRTFNFREKLADALDKVDLLYISRIQAERHADKKALKTLGGGMTLTTQLMRRAKKDAVILDALPRVNEIDEAVDSDPRAAYFRQAENGLYVRMALLDSVLQY